MFIVSLLGLLLRFFFVTPISFNYSNLLHAHSHAAMLGGIYLGLMILTYKLFLKQSAKSKLFRWIFYVNNFSILGMLLSFPFQGYALISISFSCLYLLSSYWFSWFAIKYVPENIKNKTSWKFIKMGLFYLVLSSVGTWAIGPIAGTVGLDSFWFNDALYFFLHFLYSGFFFLILIGVLFYFLEKEGITFPEKKVDRLYVNLNIGIFLSYFLSTLWIKPPVLFYLLGGIGAVYQLYGYGILFDLLRSKKERIHRLFSAFSIKLLYLAGTLLMIRIIMQAFSAIPYFAEIAFQFGDFIIGYLHLVFLGIVIPAMLVFMNRKGLIHLPKTGIRIFLSAFFLTEMLIFYKAIAFWLSLPMFTSYYLVLALFSCLYPIALGWLFFGNLKRIGR